MGARRRAQGRDVGTTVGARARAPAAKTRQVGQVGQVGGPEGYYYVCFHDRLVTVVLTRCRPRGQATTENLEWVHSSVMWPSIDDRLIYLRCEGVPPMPGMHHQFRQQPRASILMRRATHISSTTMTTVGKYSIIVQSIYSNTTILLLIGLHMMILRILTVSCMSQRVRGVGCCTKSSPPSAQSRPNRLKKNVVCMIGSAHCMEVYYERRNCRLFEVRIMSDLAQDCCLRLEVQFRRLLTACHVYRPSNPSAAVRISHHGCYSASCGDITALHTTTS